MHAPHNIYLVLEYMEHDIHGLIDKKLALDVSQIKCIMMQVLEGVSYIHSQNVMHRDIKGANILVDNKGNIKITDFGLARKFDIRQGVNLTNRVVTLWYRSPELLLGSEHYTTAVDLWSVGCLFAELLTSKALFAAGNEVGVLDSIYRKCGFPTEETWPGVSLLKYYKEMVPSEKYSRTLHDVLKSFPKYGFINCDWDNKVY